MGSRSLAMLVLVTMLLAGCLGGDPQGADEDADKADAPTTTATPTSGTDTDGTDDEPTGNGSDNGDDDPSSGSDTSDTTNDTRKPSPPQEQKKDSPDELERPGDYALLPYREDRNEDVKLEAPIWKAGDRWTWEWELFTVWCEGGTAGTKIPFEFRDIVNGTSTYLGVDTYEVDRTVWCPGEEKPRSRSTLTFLQDELIQIENDGFVARTLLFPLEDGKRWRWMHDEDRNVTSEITYEATYLWEGRAIAAWRVVSEYEDVPLVQEVVFSTHADNIVYRQHRYEGTPVAEANLKSFQRAS